MNNLSPIWIPIVAMMIPIAGIIAGALGGYQRRRASADQQMAMIARGVPLAEIEAFMQRTTPIANEDRPINDPLRSLSNSRRAAVVLISVGTGLIIFFLIFGSVMLTHVDKDAGWVLIAVSAAGLIPLAIGIGFLFDYNLQKRELSRFGLEVEADKR